ncbi:MAG: hypothetical protein PHC75_10030, partial [Burkholderiales bacterium]|nr:hypothetical protein [Burkholderiales bacterium]
MKNRLFWFSVLSLGLASCNSNSGSNTNSDLKLDVLNGIVTSKCLLKGGIASLEDDIPKEIANGVIRQTHVILTCKNNARYDVTKSVKFTVNNTNILTIDKNKGITAKANGNTFIIYSYNGGDNIRRDISVTNATIKDFSLYTDATAFNVGEIIKIKAQALFTDDKTTNDLDPTILTWKSSDPHIASVDNGSIKLHAKGSVLITAHYKQLSAEYRININDAVLKDIVITPKQDIILDPLLNSDVEVGANAIFSDSSETPIDKDELKCSSSDNKVASFVNGCLLELSENVTKSQNINITVSYKNKATSKNVSISTGNISELRLELDGSNLLPNSSPRKYTIYAKSGSSFIDATDNLALVSSDPSIIKVENGTIIPLKTGTVKLSTKYNANGKEILAEKNVTIGNVDVNFPEDFPKGSEYPISVKIINEHGMSIDKTNDAVITSDNTNVIQIIDKNNLIAK